MSRIGNKPIEITDGAKVTITGHDVTVAGKVGTLKMTHRPEVTVKVEGNEIIVARKSENRASRAFHGLTRALIQNMVIGATKGYEKELEVNGVGYVAKMQGKQVSLKVGFADTRFVSVPDGVKVEINQTRIKVTGPDKQLVGQTAAAIRAVRKPEPYNGKGVRYVDERILRKLGKAFAK
jgi:large subunit ribosomal protein L6